MKGGRLKVGLIGCGSIEGQVHFNTLKHLREVDFVAFAETDPVRRKAVSRWAPHAAVFEHYQELLDSPEVQAVIICLPPGLHVEAAIIALQKKIPVYLEKPIAVSTEEARPLVLGWRESGLPGMIGFNYRFHPLYQEAKKWIEAGEIGHPVLIRSVFSTSGRNLPDWKLSRKTGGGALLDLGSHHIDLISFLCDQEVTKVFCLESTRRSENDTAVLEWQLTNGVVAQSFCSLGSVEEDRLDVYGDSGKLRIDRYHSFEIQVTRNNTRFFEFGPLFPRRFALNKILYPTKEPSYETAIRAFVSAVQWKHAASPDFLDGFRNLAILEAAEESSRTGKAIDLLPNEIT